MMVDRPIGANGINAAGGYGPPGGGYPPGPPGGGYGGPPPAFGPPAPPGGGYGGPPPGPYGGPAAPPPHGGPLLPPGVEVNTTFPLILSIVNIATCCCVPLGIAGVVFAMQAGNAKKVGDFATAQSKNKTAMLMGIIGAVGGLLAYASAVVYWMLVANSASTP